MAGVASAVLPEPPAEIRPPKSRRRTMKCSNASAISVTALPRSPVNTACSPCGWQRATSRGCTIAADGFPDVARSTVTTVRPSFSRQLRRVAQFPALGIERARNIRGAPCAGRDGKLDDPGRLDGRRLRWLSGIPRDWTVDVHRRPARIAAHCAFVLGSRQFDCLAALHREDADLRGRLLGLCSGAILVLVRSLDAKQALLQRAIRRELRHRHRARDAPVHHHVHRIGHRNGHTQILLDQQHRDFAVRHERLQHHLDLLHDHRREALGGLVHHQQPRVEQQGARDGEHLLLATRELGAAVRLALREARKRAVGALDGPRTLARSRCEPEMLVHCQRGPDPAPLRT